MCNHTTDDPIVNNLQSIAIAATVDPSFGEWLRNVELALRNKSAIAHRSNHVLHNCYKDGLTPSFVATRLDQTFDALQPRLFASVK